MLNFLSNFNKYLNKSFFESTEVYDFLNDSAGKMNPEEVLEIAKPFGKERGWTGEYDHIITGNEKPYLVREIKTGRVFWFVNFSILFASGSEVAPQCDRILGHVSVDDVTGKVIEVKGKRD